MLFLIYLITFLGYSIFSKLYHFTNFCLGLSFRFAQLLLSFGFYFFVAFAQSLVIFCLVFTVFAQFHLSYIKFFSVFDQFLISFFSDLFSFCSFFYFHKQIAQALGSSQTPKSVLYDIFVYQVPLFLHKRETNLVSILQSL